MPFQSPTHQFDPAHNHDETPEFEPLKVSSEARTAGSFQEGEALLSPQAPSILRGLFERMDANKDGGLDRDEVKGHLKAIGVQGGLLGMVHSKVSKKFLKELDTNKDEKVTWAEFLSVAKDVLPDSLFDESGAVNMELLDSMFAGIDADTSGDLSLEEMNTYGLQELPEGTDHKAILADLSARFGVDTMDADGSGGISREEMEAAAHEIARIKEMEGEMDVDA